ncbi:WAS/WASL-interacting protein family member 1-like [Accipiter gentilis]|uniref:WAS/WASL-interacting protein family member 1-like n=1 Tax=Astur gentilis TaxID=8957 RepID=UPI0021102595|nr:WAS/WASL-interacting protein family member 1-like [Accipiter gentilis]
MGRAGARRRRVPGRLREEAAAAAAAGAAMPAPTKLASPPPPPSEAQLRPGTAPPRSPQRPGPIAASSRRAASSSSSSSSSSASSPRPGHRRRCGGDAPGAGAGREEEEEEEEEEEGSGPARPVAQRRPPDGAAQTSPLPPGFVGNQPSKSLSRWSGQAGAPAIVPAPLGRATKLLRVPLGPSSRGKARLWEREHLGAMTPSASSARRCGSAPARRGQVPSLRCTQQHPDAGGRGGEPPKTPLCLRERHPWVGRGQKSPRV